MAEKKYVYKCEVNRTLVHNGVILSTQYFVDTALDCIFDAKGANLFS